MQCFRVVVALCLAIVAATGALSGVHDAVTNPTYANKRGAACVTLPLLHAGGAVIKGGSLLGLVAAAPILVIGRSVGHMLDMPRETLTINIEVQMV